MRVGFVVAFQCKATAAPRAALPVPISVCTIVLCGYANSGMAAGVCRWFIVTASLSLNVSIVGSLSQLSVSECTYRLFIVRTVCI